MQHREVHFELDGWVLFWADVERQGDTPDPFAAARTTVAERLRARLTREALSGDPTVAALRKLFRAAGCDPTRYRPASEALARRLLKGDPMPAIHPLVDLNNCLSAELLVPCCAIAEGTITPPLVLRAGRAGESYDSLRGSVFDLEGKPVLVDRDGPFDAPITGSQRVKVTPATRRCQVVAYLPAGVVDLATAAAALQRVLTDVTEVVVHMPQL